ncbi:hypothetical protein [Kribbella sp. NPDC050470]
MQLEAIRHAAKVVRSSGVALRELVRGQHLRAALAQVRVTVFGWTGLQ